MSEHEFSRHNYRRLIAAGALLATTALTAACSSGGAPSATRTNSEPPTPTSNVSERPGKAPTDDYGVKCTGVEAARTSVPKELQDRSGMPKLTGFTIRVSYSESGASIADDETKTDFAVSYGSNNENYPYVIGVDNNLVMENERTVELGVEQGEVVRLAPVITGMRKSGDTITSYSAACEEVALRAEVQ